MKKRFVATVKFIFETDDVDVKDIVMDAGSYSTCGRGNFEVEFSLVNGSVYDDFSGISSELIEIKKIED